MNTGRPTASSERVGRLLFLMTFLASTLLLQSCSNVATSPSPSPTAAPTLVSIQISPTTPYLPLAGSRQMIATGVYSNGTQVDLTQKVTWSASSVSLYNPADIQFLSVNSSGLVSGVQLGEGALSATMASVTGTLSLTVTTNGYASSTFGTLVVPFGSGEIDAAYLPQSQATVQGVYVVQELNLDADQFTSILPVPSALIASIPMPAGFVPNATAASQANFQVAVISYTSPDVQVIDASNTSVDLTNNTVIATYKAPVTKSVTFNGKTCMICAAVVNPLNNDLLLSTAEGYYTMDLNSGVFSALSLNATAFPAPSFAVNPIASSPYIVSPTFGQDPKFSSEVQVLNLPTSSSPQGAVTSYTNFGLTAPDAAAIDLVANTSASSVVTNTVTVVDAGANFQAFVTLGDSSQTTSSAPVANLGICKGQPTGVSLDMAAFGLAPFPGPTKSSSPTLFLSRPSTDCVGFELINVAPDSTVYGYGTLPSTPDGKIFATATDPNAISTYNTVFGSGNSYGVLMDTTQKWVAKINLASVTGNIPAGDVLPSGFDISTFLALLPSPVEYLPTPATIAVLSEYNVPFGNQGVGTASIPIQISLTNINSTPMTNLQISQFAISGPNAGDFSQTNTCGNLVADQSKCVISITFTPGAMGSRSATLSITDDGGDSPQVVTLSGTGVASGT